MPPGRVVRRVLGLARRGIARGVAQRAASAARGPVPPGWLSDRSSKRNLRRGKCHQPLSTQPVRGYAGAVTALSTVEHLLRQAPRGTRNQASTCAALFWVLQMCRSGELRQIACGTVERRFARVRARLRQRSSSAQPLPGHCWYSSSVCFVTEQLYADFLRLVQSQGSKIWIWLVNAR